MIQTVLICDFKMWVQIQTGRCIIQMPKQECIVGWIVWDWKNITSADTVMQKSGGLEKLD